MALSIVQAVKAENTTGTQATHAITLTGGNLVDVGVSEFLGSNAAGAGSVSDGTNTYTNIQTSAKTPSGCALNDYYAKNVTGGSYTLTINAHTGANGVVGVAHEVSGADTSSPLDQSNKGSGSATTSPSGPSITPSGSSSIAFSSLTNDDGSSSATLTPGNGFSDYSTSSSKETNGSSYPPIDDANDVLSSSASVHATWTTSSYAWAATIRNYKAASGGGNSYSKTISVAIGSAVTIARLAGYFRTLAVAVAIATSLTRLAGYVRTLGSPIASAVVVARVYGALRTLGSSVVVLATISRLAGYGRVIASAIGQQTVIGYVGEQVARVFNRMMSGLGF